MTDDEATYRARAASERASAAATVLPNVRHRCEKAAQAWDAMASRSARLHSKKLEREAAAAAQGDAADLPEH